MYLVGVVIVVADIGQEVGVAACERRDLYIKRPCISGAVLQYYSLLTLVDGPEMKALPMILAADGPSESPAMYPPPPPFALRVSLLKRLYCRWNTHPVVDDIVCKVINAFDLWIARLVVNVKRAEDADASVGLHQATARVSLKSLRDNRVGYRDVVDRTLIQSIPVSTCETMQVNLH